MKRFFVLIAALTAFTAVSANATTLVVGFNNVGISAGPGISMTLPGGYLSGYQALGAGYGISARFTGAGGKNDATFYAGHLGVGKSFSLNGLGRVTPSLRVGFQSLNVGMANLSAGYAGIHVRYVYPVTNAVHLYVAGGFGRDFATSVSGMKTIGGLEYSGGGGVWFNTGYGALQAGYQYRHLPLSTSSDLHLNTGQVVIGYAVRF
ncbi:hypothetical protein [Candidatus Igneacidithiobacillus taiwanensis]|uniref:hypothetical protein n=1 Tax=Candidatus Igneacidithiobacillus taiwanensis TaxID=1945924 RepID=UPI002899B2FE|nr:hypothetical protein [Candidatus Igneacidithiobacillus taiwanensis]